ncbi:glycosyltransferase [Tautonia plasticadhaerens]|nr:glycosyltransferase family 2 protein [Tautonia plasticadhaerens]
MVKVWAGDDRHDFRYISKSLPSLLNSDLPLNIRIILIDDCSPSREISPYLEHLARSHDRVEVWRNPYNMGPNTGQSYNFPRVVDRYPHAEFFVLCDDDMIYHPGWLQRLISVYREAAEVGLNGVFTALNVPARPAYSTVCLPTSEVLLKKRQMAQNWLLPRDVYEAVGPFRVTELAFDHDYGLRLSAAGYPVICMKPSYVQNIGYRGAYQTDNSLTAKDYVGRLDWDLCLADALWTARRASTRLAQACFARIPEGGAKRSLRRIRDDLTQS